MTQAARRRAGRPRAGPPRRAGLRPPERGSPRRRASRTDGCGCVSGRSAGRGLSTVGRGPARQAESAGRGARAGPRARGRSAIIRAGASSGDGSTGPPTAPRAASRPAAQTRPRTAARAGEQASKIAPSRIAAPTQISAAEIASVADQRREDAVERLAAGTGPVPGGCHVGDPERRAEHGAGDSGPGPGERGRA